MGWFRLEGPNAEGAFRIINKYFGLLYAASGGESGGDHPMWVTSYFSYESPKARWFIEESGSTIKLRNKAYGYMYSAHGGAQGSEHRVWATPDLSYDNAKAHYEVWT